MITQIMRIERLHHLIRLKATGSPKQCARKLGVSERQLYRLLEAMKELGAPINYEGSLGSYCYEYEVESYFGFEKLVRTEKNKNLLKL